MRNYIIGTCGHIDHGKTALIKALNGFEGDTTKEEKQRGITIDLSFSNITQDDQNIAFIDVPGHEKLIKNMIAGAFGFDCVMIAVSAAEGIKPQTVEHLEILNALGVKNAILIITKKDLVDDKELQSKIAEVQAFVQEYDFDLSFTHAVSIYDESSIQVLKDKLFALNASTKEQENFFRYYVDRIFSIQGAGTIVTGTVLGKPIELNEKLFICDLTKEVKVKNIQVHDQDAQTATISNRAAINLHGINASAVKRGMLISKKGYMRGFDQIDISFKALKGEKLQHNKNYFLYIGSKRVDVKVLLLKEGQEERGFATLKAKEDIYSIYGERLILRDGSRTIAGGAVLNPIADPMRKRQKLELLDALNDQDFTQAYAVLLNAHKKGLGLVSSAQRFALSHEEAIANAKALENAFVDEKALVIYPIETKELIKQSIKDIYTKNKYALLSNASIALRMKWASEAFIQVVLDELIKENFLVESERLYRNANIKEDFKDSLQQTFLDRLEKEKYTPTAPYNIYDELDIDRKLGDNILKALTSKKQVIRMQHNLFIHAQSLNEIVLEMKKIMKDEGYINLKNFKEKFPMSRKYLVTYLDYLDNFSQIKKEGDKRYFLSENL